MQISPRKFNILVFVTIVALIIVYFVFNFVYNKGYLRLEGRAPFEFTVNNELTVCSESPCTVKLMQGSYVVKANKKGYKEEEVEVLVRRKSTASVALNFEFVPIVRKLEAVATDHFETGDAKSDNFFLVNTESTNSDSLIAQSLRTRKNGKIQIVSNFLKPLEEPKIFSSDDGNFVIAYDAQGGEMFLVNLLKDSRLKILTLGGVADIKFSPSNEKILVGTALPSNDNVLAYEIYDLQGGRVRENSKIVAESSSIVWRDENNILYAVEQEYSPFQTGVKKILRSGGGLQIVTNRNSFIVNYNLGFDKYTNMYEPDMFISDVSVDENGTVLFGSGENVWEMKFKE